MKKLIAALFVFLVFVFILGYGLFRTSKLRRFQFFGGLTARVETDQPFIALTFDDAPSPHSDEVLSVLSEKGIKATFYVIGKQAEVYPEELKRISQNSHELGNHSYSHHRMILTTLPFIDQEIRKTDTIIQNAGYTGEITFRPPNGKKLFLLPWYLREHNRKTIMWDVEPDTYAGGDAGNITSYTLDHVRPGSIILLHPFCEKSCAKDREALPEIIDGLLEKGYTFVTVSELLGNTY